MPESQPNPAPDAPDDALQARLQQLADEFGGRLLEQHVSAEGLDFTVAPEALADFVSALQRLVLSPQHGFCDACGVERADSIEAIYRLSLLMEPRRVTIRARVPRNKPALPTLSHLYKGALWAERELAEMFGVQIEGHPDLRHLLLSDGFAGFPLRKDYAMPVEHPYLAPDPLREDPGAVVGTPDEGAEA